MGSQKYLLSFFLLCLSCYPCYGILQEETSCSSGLIQEGNYREGDFDPKLSNMVNYEPEIISVDRFNQLGSLAISHNIVVNVDDFGAKSDAKDDTEAFKKAWKKACSTTNAVLVVPQNKKYLLKPLTFSGPCKSSLTMKIYGTIEASSDRLDYKRDSRYWITFKNIQNFNIEGGGTINGNGKIWWKNSCKINKSLPCTRAPTAITFYNCNNLRVMNLKVKDAQQIHLSFQKCINVQALNLIVTAPGKSPNTDGIHITGTKNIQIVNCVIRTGDDCISIVSGSEKVRAMNIICGPGHGISIGSLGSGHSEAHVSDVIVDRARFFGTTNGVRIKTWQGGSGSATNIIFQNIAMSNVTNPIIIDQNYCDQDEPCEEQNSAVQVSNVVYKNIKGTSNSEVAVKFDCSESNPCRGVLLQNINLLRDTGEGAEASCKKVKWTKKGTVFPLCHP